MMGFRAGCSEGSNEVDMTGCEGFEVEIEMWRHGALDASRVSALEAHLAQTARGRAGGARAHARPLKLHIPSHVKAMPAAHAFASSLEGFQVKSPPDERFRAPSCARRKKGSA